MVWGLLTNIKTSERNLGVSMDKAPIPDQHVNLLIPCCFVHLRDFAKVRLMVSQTEMEMFTLVYRP